jgi:Cd2+/Zn2+-exporting ATPase
MLPVIGQEPVMEAPDTSPAPAPVGELERSVVRVEGMDCASCAATVEKRVFALPGVRRATVNFAAGRLDAEHEPGLSVEEIEKAVESAGYQVSRTEGAEVTPFWRTRRAALTGASAALFLVGLALSLAGTSQVLATGAYAAAILVGGLPIFRAAVAGLRARQLDMNVLMAAATIGAAGIGEWAEAASVVVLFSAGNALQAYAVDRTRGAVRSLARLAPNEVLVRRDGGEVVVAADEVGVGEMVVVRPGERLAVDGVVVEGESAMDESPVTGEGVPVEKGPGAGVYSGALNGSGGLVVRATKKSGDSTLQRISHLVEEAQAAKAPAEVFVDRFSRVYTPIVVAGAVGLAVAPPLLGASFGEWFYRALALLIIACPCALVISTPVTVVAGIGAASRRGILVKGGAALEAAGRLRALALDKTGTLTEGRPVLARGGARWVRRRRGAGPGRGAGAPVGAPAGLRRRGPGRTPAIGNRFQVVPGQGRGGQDLGQTVPDREPPPLRRARDLPSGRRRGA